MRAALETLDAQLKVAEEAHLLVPSRTALLAAICSRLDHVLGTVNISLAKRVISLAMKALESAELMAGCTEVEVRLLMVQMLERLVDPCARTARPALALALSTSAPQRGLRRC